MVPNGFVRWALDDARTVEERCTVELLVELGVQRWNAQRKIFKSASLEEIMERKHQRARNPAYDPRYSEESLRRTAEVLGEIKSFMGTGGYRDRPTRDLAALRFFPALEDVHLAFSEVEDVSPLADLPNLRNLNLGTNSCRDFRPLSRCRELRDLQLRMGRHWPEVSGLESLPRLQSLKLQGNLLVFEGAVFPTVISGALMCEPLAARNVRGLPQLPNCRFLSVSGIEALDGIERFSKVLNLVLLKDVESFAPLTGLSELTCLYVLDLEPVDLTPLAQVPKLQFLSLDTCPIPIKLVKPRDLAVLVDSASLRELHVRGSAVIETEAAAVQAGLLSWNDLFLRPTPRPLPPLRMCAAPWNRIEQESVPKPLPNEPEIVDVGIRQCELNWVLRRIERAISRKLGTGDWGEAKGEYPRPNHPHPHIVEPKHRIVGIEFHAYALVDKFPLVIEAIREFLAELNADYRVQVWNCLKAVRRSPTREEKALEEKLQREEDDADHERRMRENEEYIERLHRYELKKQEGGKINPDEFAPKPMESIVRGEPPDEEPEADDEPGEGGVAVAKPPEPPPSWDDEEHPLADKYALMAQLTLDTFWIPLKQKDVAEYLMHRRCDEVIEEPKK